MWKFPNYHLLPTEAPARIPPRVTRVLNLRGAKTPSYAVPSGVRYQALFFSGRAEGSRSFLENQQGGQVHSADGARKHLFGTLPAWSESDRDWLRAPLQRRNLVFPRKKQWWLLPSCDLREYNANECSTLCENG